MNRGILATAWLRGEAQRMHEVLSERYRDETFIRVLPFGAVPSTHDVRGSNFVHIGVVGDRRPGRAMVAAALDNLAKGS
jgi:N-acetyl-gamma-glutamyl-phosphate reductase